MHPINVKTLTNPLILMTDIERTVIDSIKDIEKIAGLEEVLNCPDMITYLEDGKLKKYNTKHTLPF
jgi:hypothetical protein